ncbi:hypothetical protein OAZ91_00155 [bacterium]|nr:hypothetical protein [bacterium]
MESKLDQRMNLIIEYTVTVLGCAFFGTAFGLFLAPFFAGILDLASDPGETIWDRPGGMLGVGTASGGAAMGFLVCKLIRSEKRLKEELKALKPPS